MDILSLLQALAGISLVIPGIFLMVHTKGKSAFRFKIGKGGVEVSGANAGMYLLLLGVLLLFLCRLNYQRGVSLKTMEIQKRDLNLRLQVTVARADSLSAANGDLKRGFELALKQKAEVPDLRGMSWEQAREAITRNGLAVGRVDTISPGRAETALKGMGYAGAEEGMFVSGSGDTVRLSSGAVIWQRVRAGQVARLGERVAFTVVGR